MRKLLVPAIAAVAVLGLALIHFGCQKPTADAAAPTWDAPPIPETSAGMQLAAYLQHFNHEDPAQLKTYVHEHFTPEGPGGADLASRARTQSRLQRSSGGLDLYQVEEATDDAITFLARMRLTHEWRRMTLMVESAHPHRVTGIIVIPIDPPVLSHAAPQTAKELAASIDEYVERLVAADQFSGVVLVARDSTILFQNAYGMADRQRRVANTVDTRFGYASVGKMFTATTIAQLVDRGVLSYSETISAHLPEYASTQAGAVTIHQLLTHGSGIGDYFEESHRFPEVAAADDPPATFVRLIMTEPLRFTPGERFEYSNTNYLLLGEIVARRTNTTFADYVREHVFEAAGMTATSLDPPDSSNRALALGYTQLRENGSIGDGDRHLYSATPGTGSAAGGGYTTARDLARFARALRDGTLLSERAVSELLVGRVDEGRPGYRYGYGFMEREASGDAIVGHSGGFPGVDAQFEMYRSSGHVVVVLSNYELVSEPIVRHIQQLLLAPARV